MVELRGTPQKTFAENGSDYKSSPRSAKNSTLYCFSYATRPLRLRFPYLNLIHKKNRPSGRLFYGGAEGNRTPDLLNAIQALSQLSYNPTPFNTWARIA